MNDFWDNISRYPRFFVSSVAGSILVILAPFKNLLKVKKFQFIAPIILILFFGILYKVITTMTGL